MRSSGLGIVGISSNDPGHYPDDAPERLKEMAQRLAFRFPFCFDETQEVAKAYKAACTPDFYLFDKERRLVYRGQLDDSRPGTNKPVTGRDLRAAIDAVSRRNRLSPIKKPASAAVSSGSRAMRHLMPDVEPSPSRESDVCSRVWTWIAASTL